MYIKYLFSTFVFTCCLLIFIRIFYLISMKSNKFRKKSHPAKVMIILGSGGHTAEMLRILKHLDFKNYTPRVYIHAQTDALSAEKVKTLECDNKDYKLVKIYRSREVRQSYFTSIWSTILSTLNCFPILWRENPELILCNGPGTCVPLCIIAFLFKVFYITQGIVIFIESFCRVKTFSLTGKILYYIADHVVVQWAYLSKPEMALNDIIGTIPWEILASELVNTPFELQSHVTPIINMLRTPEKILNIVEKWVNASLLTIEVCIDYTWMLLNIGYWKDVPISHRYCYSLCVIIKVALLKIQFEMDPRNLVDEKKKKTVLKDIINQVDNGLLLGAPLPSAPNLLTIIAANLNRNYAEVESNAVNLGEIPIDNNIDVTILPGFSEIKRYEKPSMESFYRDIFMPKYPAILTGCINHWKALTSWTNLDYLNKVVGSRTVPIEIGSRYTDEDWTQRLVIFSEFLQKHVISNSDRIGYLAQHQLFEQIPELKEDFTIPEYCTFSDIQENDVESPDINVWFGPSNTVSPLHFDPKNNLLSQVFGYKRVILYHPDETNNLYPYGTMLLDNTAQVDPINPDYNMWPDFSKAKGMMCYLKPGEILYIPPKWWHHVTALTTSFSVSFWWK